MRHLTRARSEVLDVENMPIITHVPAHPSDMKVSAAQEHACQLAENCIQVQCMHLAMPHPFLKMISVLSLEKFHDLCLAFECDAWKCVFSNYRGACLPTKN